MFRFVTYFHKRCVISILCSSVYATTQWGFILQVVYCTSQCQKSDWTFHKRICEKPKKAEPKPSNSTAAPAADGGSSSSSTSAEPASDSKPAAAAAPPKSTAEVLGDDDLDDDEKAAVEEVRKKGYRLVDRCVRCLLGGRHCEWSIGVGLGLVRQQPCCPHYHHTRHDAGISPASSTIKKQLLLAISDPSP